MNFDKSLFKSKKVLAGILFFAIAIGVISFFDIVLTVGILFIIFLTVITALVLFKIGIKGRALFFLLLVTFLVHFAAVLFVHYANFQPFSGGDGDYQVYDFNAKIISERLHQGNFSVENLPTGHFYYPIIIGYVYALTLPEMFIGQLLNVWLAMIAVLLSYLIVLQIGGTKKQAFFVGLIVCCYPSYLFFCSLLLKDTFLVPLVLVSLLLTLKLVKNFLWKNFAILYGILLAVLHLRFYIGYVLLFTFVFCWFLLSKMNLKERLSYGIIIVVLLGFLPQFLGQGYYGIDNIKYFLNPRVVVGYREVAYASSPSSLTETPNIKTPTQKEAYASSPSSLAETPNTEIQKTETPNIKTPTTQTPLSYLTAKVFPNIEKAPSRSSSTVQVKTELNKPFNFLINWSKSFLDLLLGPLPWQIQNYRQLFVLTDIIPWYFLLFFIAKGAFVAVRRKHAALPLLIFSVASIAALSLFVPNFGLTTRIRISSFISLLCLIPLGFKLREIKNPLLKNIDKYLDKYIA